MEVISLVIPCYNEEESVPLFLSRIVEVEQELPEGVTFELVFIDDGSSDTTLKVLREAKQSHNNMRYISFSRNFGKEAAVYAGLEAATGDYLAVIDVDLQHPPELLIQMYDGIKNEGYDCVATRRANRKGEPPIRSFFARMFYKLVNKISDTKMVDAATDYRLMTRQMVDAIKSLKEYNRFSKGLFSWVGFNTKWIEFENVERLAGNTKWSFRKLCAYSLDGIIAFSVKPLAISSLMGLLFFLAAIAGIIFIVVRWILYGDPVAGWPSIVTLVLFVGGVQLFTTGILGQYLAKIYLESKGRPQYIVKEDSNFRK